MKYFLEHKIKDLRSVGLYFLITLGLLILVLVSLFLIDLSHQSIFIICLTTIFVFSSVTIILFLLAWKQKVLKQKIFYLILQFVSITFIFASIYYLFYSINPSNYNISSVINNGKLLNDYNVLFNKLHETNKKIFLVSQMETLYDTTLKAINDFDGGEGAKHSLSNGYSFSLEKKYYGAAPGGGTTGHILNFYDQNNNKFFIGEKAFGQFTPNVTLPLFQDVHNKEELFGALEVILDYLYIDQKKDAEYLNTTILLNARLSYIDFYYFSTITMTTTGYGDIIPNSSSVRLVVIIQTLFSVLFIAFGLTLLTRNFKLNDKNE